MTEQRPISRPYTRVKSLFEFKENNSMPEEAPLEKLLDLAEGRVFHGMDRKAGQEKSDLVRKAIDELRAYATASPKRPGYGDRKIDIRYSTEFGLRLRIEIEDDYKDPFRPGQPPAFWIRLKADDQNLRENPGMTVDIAFAVNGDTYYLTTGSYRKNDPRQGYKDPNTRLGNIASLTNTTYEIIRPIINGYRELAARDEIVDGGERVIKGHNFQFQLLP